MKKKTNMPRSPGILKKKKTPSEKTGGIGWCNKICDSIQGKMQMMDKKKAVAMNIPYVIAFYLVEKEAWLYRHCVGESVKEKLWVLFQNFGIAF